jgi:hypothetical protein
MVVRNLVRNPRKAMVQPLQWPVNFPKATKSKAEEKE